MGCPGFIFGLRFCVISIHPRGGLKLLSRLLNSQVV
jgi:hypothetical protein